MPLDVDETFEFECIGKSCSSRIRIYRDPDRPTVVIYSDQKGHVGTGYEFPHEWCQREVVGQHAIDPDTLLWIEYSPKVFGVDPDPKVPREVFYLLEFGVGMSRTAMKRKIIERIIGQTIGD